MTLITRKYIDQNAELHQANAGFGTGAWKWVGPVAIFARKYECETVLDYGAGKRTLEKWWPVDTELRAYDPAVPEIATLPEAADLVVALDVLEHIEPDCLDDVLDHIRSVTKKVTLLVISTRLAAKLLSDGRNAHLIVEKRDWWMEKLTPRWRHIFDAESLYPELTQKEQLSLICKV